MDLGFVSCFACASIMACGISGNWWSIGRSSGDMRSPGWLCSVPRWRSLDLWPCLSVVKEAQAEFFGCLLLVFVSGLQTWVPWWLHGFTPAQIERRLPSPVHSSTAGREELAVITGSQRWWSEIKISNDVGLIPVACTGQLQPWEAGEEQDSNLAADK